MPGFTAYRRFSRSEMSGVGNGAKARTSSGAGRGKFILTRKPGPGCRWADRGLFAIGYPSHYISFFDEVGELPNQRSEIRAARLIVIGRRPGAGDRLVH